MDMQAFFKDDQLLCHRPTLVCYPRLLFNLTKDFCPSQQQSLATIPFSYFEKSWSDWNTCLPPLPCKWGCIRYNTILLLSFFLFDRYRWEWRFESSVFQLYTTRKIAINFLVILPIKIVDLNIVQNYFFFFLKILIFNLNHLKIF